MGTHIIRIGDFKYQWSGGKYIDVFFKDSDQPCDTILMHTEDSTASLAYQFAITCQMWHSTAFVDS